MIQSELCFGVACAGSRDCGDTDGDGDVGLCSRTRASRRLYLKVCCALVYAGGLYERGVWHSREEVSMC